MTNHTTDLVNHSRTLGLDIRLGGDDPRLDAFADHLRAMFPDAKVSRWSMPCNAIAGSASITIESLWRDWLATPKGWAMADA